MIDSNRRTVLTTATAAAAATTAPQVFAQAPRRGFGVAASLAAAAADPAQLFAVKCSFDDLRLA